MDRLTSMFGGGAANTPAPPQGASRNNDDDESSSLINDATSSAKGVFSKGADTVLESIETGPDYKIAAVFLFFSVLFFFAAFTALPFIFISPKSFNLYFCFGSLFL